MRVVTVAGQALAVLVLRQFLTAPDMQQQQQQRGTANPIKDAWLRALVYLELGLAEHFGGAVSVSASKSHTMVLRQEGTASVAISTLLRIIFQCGSLNYHVLSPLFTKSSESSRDEAMVAHTCSSCLGRLSNFLVGPSSERDLPIEKHAVEITRTYARICRDASAARVAAESFGEAAADAGSFTSKNLEESCATPHKVGKSEDSHTENEAAEKQTTSSADEFFFALLGGGVFLRVLCPALLIPDRWGVLVQPLTSPHMQGGEGCDEEDYVAQLFSSGTAVSDTVSAATTIVAHLLLASREVATSPTDDDRASLLSAVEWEAVLSLSEIAPLELSTQVLSGFIAGHLNQSRTFPSSHELAEGNNIAARSHKEKAKEIARFLQRAANAVPDCSATHTTSLPPINSSSDTLALSLRHLYLRLLEM